MRRKVGIRIETSEVAGIYQHEVYDRRVNREDRAGEISDEVVGLAKQLVEALWRELPEGAGPVNLLLEYRPLKEGK